MSVQPRQGQSTSTATELGDVLVLDNDPRTSDIFRNNGADGALKVRAAVSLEQAALALNQRPADLVVVNLQINDNDGLNILSALRQRFPKMEAVALTRIANADVCLRAWRAGAADLLTGTDPVEVRGCLDRARGRRASRDKLVARHQRLRGVCRSLNKARHEISQQVNLLCHDLVRAYQDLAEQLNQTQSSGEFTSAVGEDVEIETLLRRTMEWVLKRFGPVNAAVFLPDSEQSYTLGAYLNFDTNADSMLIDVLTSTIVPQAAQATATMLLENNQAIHDMFGSEANMLANRSWMACPAYYHNDCLAVMIVFRSQGEPMDTSWPTLLEAVCPVLAQKIARSIRVYQRGLAEPENSEGTDDPGDDGAAA